MKNSICCIYNDVVYVSPDDAGFQTKKELVGIFMNLILSDLHCIPNLKDAREILIDYGVILLQSKNMFFMETYVLESKNVFVDFQTIVQEIARSQAEKYCRLMRKSQRQPLTNIKTLKLHESEDQNTLGMDSNAALVEAEKFKQ